MQRSLYGRGGVVTKEQLDKLASLEGKPTPRVNDDLSEETPSAEGTTETPRAVDSSTVPDRRSADAAQSPLASTQNTSRRSKWVVAAVGAGMLSVGLGVGLGVGIVATKAPLAHAVPPSAAMFDTESVVYFGEVEQSRVWAARDHEGNRCVIAAVASGEGGSVACEADSSTVVLSVPDEETNTTVRYVMSFTSDSQLPSLAAFRA